MTTLNFIKKNAMALIAVIAILGFSSFKLASLNDDDDVRTLAYNAEDDQYQEVENYDPARCVLGEEICSFTTDASTEDVPEAFDLEELETYIDFLTQVGEAEKQYLFPPKP